MKTFATVLVCLAAAIVLGQGWRTVTVRDAGLSFSMPVLPQASQRTDQDGSVKVTTRLWVGSAKDANYVVSVSLIPGGAPAGFTNNMKEGMVKGFVNSTGAKIETDKVVAYGKASGRQITFTTGAGAKGALWIVERKNKVFSMTMAKKSGAIDPERNRFFGSLKFTD